MQIEVGSDEDVVSGHRSGLAFVHGARAPRRRIGRILGLVLARDDEAAVGIVVEVGVVFGDEGVAAPLVDHLMQRTLHAEQRYFVDVSGIRDGLRDVLVARGHAVEGTVRLDVIERQAFGIQECLERTDLIKQAVRQLLAVDLHLPPSEALQVRQGRMSADLDAELLGELYRLAHVIEVGRMEAASHVGDIDVRHQSLVVTHLVEAIGLAHVAIDHDHSPVSSQRLAFDPRVRPPAGAPGTAGGALPVYFDTR